MSQDTALPILAGSPESASPNLERAVLPVPLREPLKDHEAYRIFVSGGPEGILASRIEAIDDVWVRLHIQSSPYRGEIMDVRIEQICAVGRTRLRQDTKARSFTARGG